jgi:predicted ABC-type transport system involved in lysophospholipase L1 biosynthesis ATPase subunit
VGDNVELPLLLVGESHHDARASREVLASLGIEELAAAPGELSAASSNAPHAGTRQSP